MKSDGTEIYVGDCFISRCLFDNLVGESHEIQRQKMIEENNVKVAGDPSIVWSVGGVSDPTEMITPQIWMRLILFHKIISHLATIDGV